MEVVSYVRLVVVGLAVGCGCGRIGFGRTDAAVDDSRLDGSADALVVDARVGTGDNGTCATAVEIPIGSSFANEVVDATDDVAPWGVCPNGPEVVYRVTVPDATTISIVATASFNGQITTGSTCPPTLTGPSSCYTMTANQVFDRSYSLAAGTTYIIVDKLSGSGTSFSIAVQ